MGTMLTLFIASLAMPHTWIGLVLMLVFGYLWGKGVGRRDGYHVGHHDGYREGHEDGYEEAVDEDDDPDDDLPRRPRPDPWD